MMDDGGCCTRKCLKATIIYTSVVNMILTGCSIGFTLGYAGTVANSLYSSFLLVPVDVAIIYVNCRIIFNISAYTFPTLEALGDLRADVGRLVAFSLVAFSAWINSIVQLAIYGWAKRAEGLLTNHLCSYVWVLSFIVAGCAGGYYNQITRPLKTLVQQSMQQTPMQQATMQQVPMQQATMQQVPMQQPVFMQLVPVQQVPMQQVPVQQGFSTIPSPVSTAFVPSKPDTTYENQATTADSTTTL